MVVADMISAKQRAIETVASMDIPHSDTCLNIPHFFTLCSTALVVRLDVTLGRCLKSDLNSIQRAGIDSAGSNCPICPPRK